MLRRIHELRHRAERALGLDVLRLMPSTAVAVFKYRVTKGHPSPAALPEAVLPVVIGNVAVLSLHGKFPRTKCFVQVDLNAFGVRWTDEHCLPLAALEDILLVNSSKSSDNTASARKSSDNRLSRRVSHKAAAAINLARRCSRPEGCDEPRTPRRTLRITLTDRGGIPNVLELRTSDANHAAAWAEGLRQLKTLRWCGSSAHWWWAVSCMTGTTERGASGVLRRSELKSLLMRANAAHLNTSQLENELRNIDMSERQLQLPSWLVRPCVLQLSRAGDASPRGKQQAERIANNSGSHPWLRALSGPFRRGLGASLGPVLSGSYPSEEINMCYAAGLLLCLSTASQRIAEVFDAYSVDERLGITEWLMFVRTEQDDLWGSDSSDDQNSSSIGIGPEADRASVHPDATLSLLQFTQRILSVENNAVAPKGYPSTTDHLHEPLAHYWNACSHNSYIIGDQLTGRSSADAYSRQLLQQCRHLEIVGNLRSSPRPPGVAFAVAFSPVSLLFDPQCDRTAGMEGLEIPKSRTVTVLCTRIQTLAVPVYGLLSPATVVWIPYAAAFCSVIPFDEVVKAIAETAFVASDLPVILSLEVTQAAPTRAPVIYSTALLDPQRFPAGCRCTATSSSKIGWQRIWSSDLVIACSL